MVGWAVFVMSSCTEPVAKMLAISSKACSAGEEKLDPCSFFTLEKMMMNDDDDDDDDDDDG